MEAVFPELVNSSKLGDTDEEILTLNYSGFGVIAIAAIQEILEQQRKENASLQAENRNLKNKVNQLSERLDDLESRFSLVTKSMK